MQCPEFYNVKRTSVKNANNFYSICRVCNEYQTFDSSTKTFKWKEEGYWSHLEPFETLFSKHLHKLLNVKERILVKKLEICQKNLMSNDVNLRSRFLVIKRLNFVPLHFTYFVTVKSKARVINVCIESQTNWAAYAIVNL